MNRRSLRWLWRSALLFGFVCALVGAGAAYYISTQLPTMYEARASLIAQTMGETYAEVAVSRPVLEGVVSRLRLPMTAGALAGSVEARASRTSALLTIIARDSEAERAAAIANAIADQLVQMAPSISGSSAEVQRSIQADLATVQAEIAKTEAAAAALSLQSNPTSAQGVELQALQSQLATLLSVRSTLLTLGVSYSQTLLTILAPAEAPVNPSSPQAPLAGAVGGLLGMAVGIGTALFVGYLRSPENRLGLESVAS